MSISAVFLSGLTGLRAAQTGLKAVTQNIANANTPGYVRTEVMLSAPTGIGLGGGVEVTGIRRAADRFLATASYLAEAARGASAARADILDRAQLAFGDPNSGSTIFSSLDSFWSALTELGVDPASSLRRNDAVSALASTFDEVQRVGASLQGLISEADERIAESVEEAQDLVNRIAALNREIQLTRRTGADSSSAENAQAALVDRLAVLIEINVSPQNDGGVQVRSTGGALLVGVDAAQFSYSPTSSSFAARNAIAYNPQLGANASLDQYLLDGEIAGLIHARDRDLMGMVEALGGFSGALADALNAVHNENASSPAASELVGRQTGLIGSDAVGFSGRAVVGIVNANGELRQRLTIDFDAQTITGESPAAVYSFAPGFIDDFESALNSALGAASPAGSATFEEGVLSLSLGAGGGLVIQQDPSAPSSRAGRGFSHFFGLNDLVSRETPLFFESGIRGADDHGFGASGELIYQVRDDVGRLLGQRTISFGSAGTTWNSLLSTLNASGTGLGDFGTFALDAQTGRMSFTPFAGVTVELNYDSTSRGDTGVSFTSLHGLSRAATAGRALDVAVNDAVRADPLRLAVGRPDLTGALNSKIIEAGDGRGASALSAARDRQRGFPAAGVLGSQTTTLANYAARLGGEAGRLAQDAERAAAGANAVATAANDRRAEVESVSLDDELMKMTVYQNAYAASARVLQTATEMLDVLLSLGLR
jgi:flagellar hook-associated protein 1 FlgK